MCSPQASIDKGQLSFDTFQSMETTNNSAYTKAGREIHFHKTGRSRLPVLPLFRAYQLSLILFSGLAGSSATGEQTDRAKMAQNPMADVIKMEFNNSFNQGYGHKDQTEYALTYKPSMVSALSEQWNIVNLIDVSFLYQPGRVPGEKDSFGIGDTTYESFIGPSGEHTFYWGIGPSLQIPTATDNQLGTRKWSAGLGGTGTIVKGPIVAGVRANHLWSFAGDDDRADVNLSTIEYFLYANLGDGWWIGTSPVNTANWEADQNEIWTIPVGGGFGKMFMSGDQPINLKLEAYSFLEAPAYEADWSIMLGIQLLLPEEVLFMSGK